MEVANVPKRKKKRERGGQEPAPYSMLQKIKDFLSGPLLKLLLLVIAIAGLVGLVVVTVKFIYQISDWMNEMEEQRTRQRNLRAPRL
ncbi:hypothetical protein BRADI_2g00247v3 [Brachypodium distachyon]|nr:hypothetical protein BRADI_2g00247v3 [Brachypodium distachyon]